MKEYQQHVYPKIEKEEEQNSRKQKWGAQFEKLVQAGQTLRPVGFGRCNNGVNLAVGVSSNIPQ